LPFLLACYAPSLSGITKEVDKVDNSVDNDDTPSDAVSPIDARHIVTLGMIVAGVMLLIAVVAVAGAIASVRP